MLERDDLDESFTSSSSCPSTWSGAAGCGLTGFITAAPIRTALPNPTPKCRNLDFLDVGWGGDVRLLRRHLPRTFLNLRLSPVEIVKQTPEQIRQTIRTLVRQSDNPWLTGVCCINMDQHVSDEQVAAIFDEVECLRQEYATAEEAT